MAKGEDVITARIFLGIEAFTDENHRKVLLKRHTDYSLFPPAAAFEVVGLIEPVTLDL